MNRGAVTKRGRVTLPKCPRDCLDLLPETKRRRRFLDEAKRADVAMQESGIGYAMPNVHAYVAAKVRGEQVKRPSPVKWRK